jgi:hypothetical protein
MRWADARICGQAWVGNEGVLVKPIRGPRTTGFTSLHGEDASAGWRRATLAGAYMPQPPIDSLDGQQQKGQVTAVLPQLSTHLVAPPDDEGIGRGARCRRPER